MKLQNSGQLAKWCWPTWGGRSPAPSTALAKPPSSMRRYPVDEMWCVLGGEWAVLIEHDSSNSKTFCFKPNQLCSGVGGNVDRDLAGPAWSGCQHQACQAVERQCEGIISQWNTHLKVWILVLQAAIDFDEVAQGLNKRVIIQQAVFQVTFSSLYLHLMSYEIMIFLIK